MKSIQVSKLSSGFENVSVQNVDAPNPASGQVKVRMLLSPVNPSDINFIRGDYRLALQAMIWNVGRDTPSFSPTQLLPYPALPYALGGEGVGIVESCGKGWLAKRLLGKRVAVAGGPPNGTWQEYCVVDAKKALPLPPTLSDEQAAMFIVNPLSAYAMLSKVLKVKSGEWLIQSAAGSALGQIVIRLSKVFGFRTINLVRSTASAETVKMAGGDVVVDTTTEDICGIVARATKGQGVRYAMDCVGGSLATEMLRCLSIDGHMVVYGTLANEPISFSSRDLMMPVTRMSGFYTPNWLSQQSPLTILTILHRLKKLQSAGIFDASVERIFPVEDVVDALNLATTPGRGGKVLLRMSER